MAQHPLQLNLVLHGTWGIEENGPNSGQPPIRLVTIDHHHHSILAGDRDNPKTRLNVGAYKLQVDTQGDGTQEFAAGLNPTVSQSDNGGKPVRGAGPNIVSIELDHPQRIHSVRRYQIGQGEQLFETSIPKTQTHISLVQVLEYSVTSLQNLTLFPLGRNLPPVDLNWGSLLNEELRVINLHLFAEPDKRQFDKIVEEERNNPAKKPHFKEVFENLGKAFGLIMTPLKAVDPAPDVETQPIKGLDWRDTVGLHELRNRPAVSPVNCDMCVFKNR